MPLTRTPLRGFLRSLGLDGDDILVEFQFNPEKLQDKRQVTYSSINAPGLIMPVRQYNHGGDRTLSFSVHVDATFVDPATDRVEIALDDGGGITPELNKYRAFVYPQTHDWSSAGGSFTQLYDQTQQFSAPPLCQFGFGDRLIDCLVTEVSISETLFNDQLAPLRAEVQLTLVERTLYGNEPTPPPRS